MTVVERLLVSPNKQGCWLLPGQIPAATNQGLSLPNKVVNFQRLPADRNAPAKQTSYWYPSKRPYINSINPDRKGFPKSLSGARRRAYEIGDGDDCRLLRRGRRANPSDGHVLSGLRDRSRRDPWRYSREPASALNSVALISGARVCASVVLPAPGNPIMRIFMCHIPLLEGRPGLS